MVERDRVIILSHRGLWLTPQEKNGRSAFERTINAGFGTETDVRDRLGELVVAHDPPDQNAPSLEDLIALFQGSGLPLAVNVKADGLSLPLSAAFQGKDIDWFAFDMSGPETLRYAAAGVPFFTRHSDAEPQPVLYSDAKGVWLDAFWSDWFDVSVVVAHLERGKRVCVVSPELHGRPWLAQWSMLRDIAHRDNVMICTDRPAEAREFFGR